METLAARIARDGGLAEIDAVGWAIRVAFSVEQIHALGGVHGRLSADGILVEADRCTSEGRLLPFAQLPENVAYHSPERERGEGGSQADDTWAVAVMLYLGLSGSLPFSGATDDEVRKKIRNVPAPPLAVFDIGDDALQGIVDRALARTREARTATVGDLRRELESWRPDAMLDALPPLLVDEDPDEEVTMIQSGLPGNLREMIDAVSAPAPRKISPPRPSTAPPPSDIPDVLAAAVVATPSAPPGPMDEDPDEATVMLRPGIKKVDLPGLLDDEPGRDRSDDLFAVPSSRAGVPRIESGPPSAGGPASAPPSSAPPASAPAPASAPSARPAPVAPVAAAPAPVRRVSNLVLFGAAVLTGVAAWFFLGRAGSPDVTPPGPTSAAVSAEPATPPPRGATSVVVGGDPRIPATGTASTGATPSAAVTMGETPKPPAQPVTMGETPKPPVLPASAGVSASVAAPAGLAACVLPLFPADSFDATTDFSFVCAEADPIKGGSAVRTQLVRAHHNISDGMREWALLGWYEAAAFSVIRARCCPSAPPLQIPEVHGCTSASELVAGISAAAAATTDPADKALKKAVDAYTSNIYCIVRAGMATRFGRVANPQGGEDTTFMRFMARVVGAKR